jgi:putative ABC transport system permease protein
MDGLAADLRLAAWRLGATPLFTIFAVLSLAVGVGVTTAVYSVVASVFMKDFGFRDPEQIVFVVTPYEARMTHGTISVPDFHDLRASQTAFSSLSASSRIIAAVTSLTITELLSAEAVDGAYFQTFGVGAELGRVILPGDQRAAARVAMLSHRVWRGRFAADPAIVGQTVRIAGQPFEVVGVAPSSFDGAASGPLRFRTDLWIPLGTEPSIAAQSPTRVNGDERERRRLQVFGRLSPSATLEKASAELATIAAGLDRAYPGRIKGAPGRPTERPWKARTVAALAREDNFARRFGMTLIGLVALVLVVACTNLANLVLARGTNRHQELAVRCALGAPRWRLIREQCAESVFLAVGGAVAAALVFQALRVVMDVEYQLPLPMGGQVTLAIQPALDATVLAIAVVSLLLSLVVFGVEPALQLTRLRDLKDALAAGGHSVGNPRTRRQQTLLRWQVAVSAGFFVVATMFVKYSVAEARHDSGVDLAHLGVAVLNFQSQQWDEARVRRALERVQAEARVDPVVSAVSVSTGMPFGLRPLRFLLAIPGAPSVPAADVSVTGIAATPSIFTTLGVPMIRGRGFDERDHAGAAPVVVISEYTARKVFGTVDAVGRALVLQHVHSRVTATVVGVARDTDVGHVLAEPRAFLYLPLAQRYDPYLAVAVRSPGGAAVAARALRAALRRADPDMAVDMLGTGRSTMAGLLVLVRAIGGTTVALGVLTLLLAMAGLFGIQSHIVAHRTREIGVRMSLGASAGQIKRMVLVDGYRPVFEGLVLGLFGGFVGRTFVRSYLDIDVSIIDPWLLFVVPIPPIVAAFCACYLPARRAAGVDPNVALRHL